MTPRVGPGRPFFIGCGVACVLLAIFFVFAFSQARYQREHRMRLLFDKLQVGMSKSEFDKLGGPANRYPATPPPSVHGTISSTAPAARHETLEYSNYDTGANDSVFVDLDGAGKVIRIEYYANDHLRNGKPNAHKP